MTQAASSDFLEPPSILRLVHSRSSPMTKLCDFCRQYVYLWTNSRTGLTRKCEENSCHSFDRIMQGLVVNVSITTNPRDLPPERQVTDIFCLCHKEELNQLHRGLVSSIVLRLRWECHISFTNFSPDPSPKQTLLHLYPLLSVARGFA